MLRAGHEAKKTPAKVIPAQAGIQSIPHSPWIPACAGMT